MKIVFIAIKEPHMTFGQVGLEIMSSLLKQRGHQVIGLTDSTFDTSNYITNDEQHNLKQIRKYKPDFIGFSVLSHRYQWCLKFARLIKGDFPLVKIIFGGCHPTALPELVIKEDCVDIVCVGEGEEAIVELLNNPERTNIKNLWFKKGSSIIRNTIRPLIEDLDSLPLPDKSLWVNLPKTVFKNYLIMVSRFCPYSCSFCFNSYMQKLYKGLGQFVRFRSVENVILELKKAKKELNIKWVLFMDDNLTLKQKWFKQFAKEYRRHIHLPYACNTHPFTIDEKRVKLLKESGCRFVMLGIQSGSEEVRQKIIGRHETNKKLLKVTNIFHKYGLSFSLDHIFGLDDSPKHLHESAELYNKARPFTVNTFQLYYFPKTQIINHKKLPPTDIQKINSGLYQKPTIRSQRYSEYLMYRNLFVLLPLIPKSIVNMFLQNNRLLQFFTKIPESVIWGSKIINNLKGGNTPSVFSHLSFLPHKLKERLRGYRGEFD